MAAMPAAMPVAMPTPVTPVPMMPAMVPMPVPAHLLRLQVIDIVLRNHGGFRTFAVRRHQARFRRNRRQRRSLRSGGKRPRACNNSKGEFQKVAAFQNISLVCDGE
jgi:hypothetical protein